MHPVRPSYRPIVRNAGQIKHLKKDTTVLAAYGNVEYDNKSQVGVERVCVVGSAAAARGKPRVADDEGHAVDFLEGIPFVGKSVLGVEVAIVPAEDDEGLVEDALRCQLREDPPAHRVHPRAKVRPKSWFAAGKDPLCHLPTWPTQ